MTSINAKSLFLVVNVDWFFLSHRLPIALAAKERGYDVTIIAIDSGDSDKIRSYGLKFIAIPTSRSGLNIFSEFKTLLFFIRLYRTAKPDIVHHVAMKPVIYGSLAARITGIHKVVNAFSGMGFVFTTKNTILKSFIIFLFKIAFKNDRIRFIFQNQDDLQEVIQSKMIDLKYCYTIKGSGIDLQEFAYSAEPQSDKVVFIFPARMLHTKGVVEFIEAAKIVDRKFPGKSEFILAGMIDLENKAGIPEPDLLAMCSIPAIKWIGHQDDILSQLIKAHVVVLPSYREGIPKTLIEACAVGRAIITTNVPGCKEVVTHEVNGLIVEKGQIQELALAIERLLLNKDLRIKMGKEGRKIAEAEFSIVNVIQKTIDIYEN
ncbi:MAG: glycosyltransferase family 4 protein [Bacteroidetes bacterium]|nr:glycosyltransferase family 4 protein [Bacteroidota bacterium]MBK8143504.1 glycosyltransferase family 4 protein [Bacteroidota bacterium]MBP6314446.1 glycosyltransferase family 4 protein [Chitinophagaceae bacterium]